MSKKSDQSKAYNELVAPTSDGGNHQTADEGVQGVGSPAGMDPGRCGVPALPNSPSAEGPAGDAATASAGPYTQDEFAALIEAVWSLEDTEDLVRFHELLHAALVFVGRVALAGTGYQWGSEARELLRSMEQRALWGPDHPVVQP